MKKVLLSSLLFLSFHIFVVADGAASNIMVTSGTPSNIVVTSTSGQSGQQDVVSSGAVSSSVADDPQPVELTPEQIAQYAALAEANAAAVQQVQTAFAAALTNVSVSLDAATNAAMQKAFLSWFSQLNADQIDPSKWQVVLQESVEGSLQALAEKGGILQPTTHDNLQSVANNFVAVAFMIALEIEQNQNGDYTYTDSNFVKKAIAAGYKVFTDIDFYKENSRTTFFNNVSSAIYNLLQAEQAAQLAS